MGAVETGGEITIEMEALDQIGISMVEIDRVLIEDTSPSSILCNESYDLRVFRIFYWRVLELEIKR